MGRTWNNDGDKVAATWCEMRWLDISSGQLKPPPSLAAGPILWFYQTASLDVFSDSRLQHVHIFDRINQDRRGDRILRTQAKETI